MELNFAHLYGDLMNTYGDLGNILVLKYYAEQLGIKVNVDLVSLDTPFDANKYHFVLFGGGQDYEQVVISKDIQNKADSLTNYIENGGPLLAVCGGYQLLGQYYIGAHGEKIPGISALSHYTLSQDHNRFIGNIEIHNDAFDENYYGFENHNGMTFLGDEEQPLGHVVSGHGNNGQDGTEGAIYKNTFCSYFHGPILTHNAPITRRLLKAAIHAADPDADLTPVDELDIQNAAVDVPEAKHNF
ncbi:glutamine amidotransferase [Lactobacillus selangorensis]|uniref:Lipid II isoglutaminyl synthase (glutamine-hydrolyzing) subunit GatD n=1 Tax=Lactobacillus selangorensis TaxID=81857 RepID=A0A0R2G2L6_9LACO|nr:hypothetical protein [Lactobacillus selangorensis]KRN29300.1 glutamine amidotransferase [Lactobacillus selangorensis]KRN34171.1 glutamine amidotransferase [Lactobacillus selangorensis]